jgi:outer membrane protein TolC
MKSIFLTILLLATCRLWAETATGSLTLSKAWEMALEANPTEEISLARVQQAVSRLQQAKGGYHPRLDLRASGSRLEYSESQKSRFPLAPDAVEQFDIGVDATWLLWDSGTRKYRTEAAGRSLAAAEAGRSTSRANLLTDVGQAFTLAQLAKENLKIALEDVAFQARQLEDSARKEAAGLNSRADRLNFEIRKRGSESIAVREQARYEDAMAVLAALLGLESAASLPEPAELYTEKPEMNVPDPETVWSEVQQTLPELRQSAEQLASAELQVKSQQGTLRPDLSLFGNLRLEREEDPNFAGDDLTNAIGVQLTWSLWNGQILQEQVREQEALVREVEAADRQLRLQTRSRLEQAVANVRASDRALELTRETFELSRENRDLVEASYRAGRATLLRLNEAQRDFNNAGSRFAAARLQLQIDWINLQRAMGTIEAFVREWDK